MNDFDETTHTKLTPKEISAMEADLNDCKRRYEEGDKLALIFAVTATHELGKSVPAWVHDVLHDVFIRHMENGIDLNKEIGNTRGERMSPRRKELHRKNVKLDRAIRIGEALAANDALTHRRKSMRRFWLGLGHDLRVSGNTLRNQWSKELRALYKRYDPDRDPYR